MEAIFLKILNMSLTATWLALAVFGLRLLLKKAPKYLTVVLWSFVAVRLCIPFSFESVFSLIPSAEPIPDNIGFAITPEIESGVSVIDSAVNPILSGVLTPTPGDSVNPAQVVLFAASVVWAVGIIAMLGYTVFSYLRIQRRVRESACLRENIWICDTIDTPFVLGIFKPRIYLPSFLNEQDMAYVIAHEQAHLNRRDHWWKPFGFLLLSLHWFNPALWVAYVLLCRDIEGACDEKVIRDQGNGIKKAYLEALINCSVPRKRIAACPLAFGEVDVKQRVKRVLRYKKPAFWLMIVAVIALMITAICLLTNPVGNNLNDQLQVFLDMHIAEAHESDHTEGNFITIDYQILDVKKRGADTTVYMWVLYEEYSCTDGLKKEISSHIPTVITATKEGGRYNLKEYWTPRDGAFYPGDIKEKFPVYLWGKALNSEKYIDKQKENCLRSAKEYFKLNDFYLTVGAENVYSITIRTEGASGGCANADGSAFKKGERIYIEQLDGYEDLRGVSITAHGKNGEVVYSFTVPEGQIGTPVTVCVSNDWLLAPKELGIMDVDDADNWLSSPVMPGGTGVHEVFDVRVSWSGYGEYALIADCLNAKEMMCSSVLHLPIRRFSTLSQLNAFKTTYANKYAMDQGYDEVKSFEENTADYDDAFFKDNDLFLVSHDTNSGSLRFDVNCIYNDGTNFCIYVNQTNNPQVVTDDMAGWFITVAIPKSATKNCTHFDAVMGDAESSFGIEHTEKRIASIVDKTESGGIVTASAIEVFYTDDIYTYSFPSIRSEYVIVTFTDGTEKTVKEALEAGEITIKDLDAYDIGYIKEVIPTNSDPFSRIIDKIIFDIDKDGREETCYLGYGTTSGLFTFKFYVSENGKGEYFDIFNTAAYWLSFVVADGELKVQGIDYGENPQTHLFDVSIKNNDIVLTENGRELEYWGEHDIDSYLVAWPPAIEANDSGDPFTVRIDGENIEPYFFCAYSGRWDGEGFLCADGADIPSQLAPYVKPGSFPVTTLTADSKLDITLAPNTAAQHILILDTQFNLLETRYEMDFSDLRAGEYWVGILVHQQGAYIAQAYQFEYTGWVGAFRLHVE